MGKSIEALARNLAAIRTGRAHPSILDSVKVTAWGSEMPLNQVATVAAQPLVEDHAGHLPLLAGARAIPEEVALAVDGPVVGEQQPGEQRTLAEVELAARLVEDVRPGQVRGQQVGDAERVLKVAKDAEAAERQKAIDAGHDLDAVLSTDDLVRSENCFFVATGITDGELLRGVRYRAGGATTHSLVMRSKSGTIRVIESHHQLRKLSSYSALDFGGAGA